MIKVNVKKKFAERTVLDFDFEFEEGKKYALIGSNGSGKTTLLKILDGETMPEKGGEISLKDKTDIVYMPQASYAFDMSLKANVMLGKPAKTFDDIKKAHFNSRVYKLISDIGLWNLKYKNASKLSGGETQKMALIRTLVAKHDILLLDEPTSAMDLQATAVAEKVILDYISEFNPTLIFSTHSVKQAQRIADFVIFLKDGRIIETATAKEFLENPQTDELKQFLSEK